MWIWIPTRPGNMGQMLCLCDGEIRLHAGRWTKYESSEASAEGNVAMALEKQTRLGLLSSTILLRPTNPDTATGSPTFAGKKVSLQKLPKRAKSKAAVALNLIISSFLRRFVVTILDNHTSLWVPVSKVARANTLSPTLQVPARSSERALAWLAESN